MQDVALTDRVVAEKPDRFIPFLRARRACLRFFVDANELVVEDPFRFNLMVGVAAHDLAFQLPFANHVIHQIVMPFGRRLRARADGRPPCEEHDNQEQVKPCFHRRFLMLRSDHECRPRLNCCIGASALKYIRACRHSVQWRYNRRCCKPYSSVPKTATWITPVHGEEVLIICFRCRISCRKRNKPERRSGILTSLTWFS